MTDHLFVSFKIYLPQLNLTFLPRSIHSEGVSDTIQSIGCPIFTGLAAILKHFSIASFCTFPNAFG